MQENLYFISASKGQIPNYNNWAPHLEISGVSETYTCFSSFVLQHGLSREGITKLQQRWQACALYPAADTRNICSYRPRRQDSDIYTAASRKSLSWDRQHEENTRVVSTHPFTPQQTPRAAPRCCKAETAAPARCPPAEPAAAARCRPPRRRLPNMHPRAGVGTTWWDGAGFICLFNRGQVVFLFLLKPPSPIPVQSKVNDDE